MKQSGWVKIVSILCPSPAHSGSFQLRMSSSCPLCANSKLMPFYKGNFVVGSLLLLVPSLGFTAVGPFLVIGSLKGLEVLTRPPRGWLYFFPLLTADVVGMPGKEAYVGISEFAPGAAAGKHYHPADEFGYVLEGTLTLEEPGKPLVTYKAGQVFHRLPKVVHEGKNTTTAQVRLLVFYVGEKGQPRIVPVQ